MKVLRKQASCLLIAVLLLSLFPLSAKADNKPTQTEVSKYALEWDGHTEIPYVFGGPGGRSIWSLEELAETGKGTDCSGFVTLVYKHFGIDITAYSGTQYNEAVEVFDSVDEAVPGDVCWWAHGHVGIYLGDNKMVHTNTSDPPTNFPHVSDLTTYGFPDKVLRMVDDISKLKPLDGSEASAADEEVKNRQGYGSIATESDLTGMPIKSTLIREQNRLNMIGRENLSTQELATLTRIEDSLNNQATTPSKWYNTLQSCAGLFCILYGVLMLICYMLDYSNVFLEVSLLSIISLNKFRIVDDLDVQSGAVGWNEGRRVTYLTVPMLIGRVVVLICVGIFLISGVLSKLLIQLLSTL